MALILGIDPGSRVTGFGLVEARGGSITHKSHGVIQLPEKEPLFIRLKVLSEGLKELLRKYQPQAVAVEKIFLGKNADSAFKLGHARGVVLAEAASANAGVFEYATRLIKKGIAGKGSADKLEVLLAVQRTLNLRKVNRLDASDALAIAIYHAHVVSIEKRILQGVEL